MGEAAPLTYQNVNFHPDRRKLDIVGSALHSLCAAKGCTWKEAYGTLIDCAGELGLMPQDRRTIHTMLEKHTFYLQGRAYAGRTVSSIIDECNENFHDGEVMIVKLSRSYSSGNYVPIVPVVQDECVRYMLQFPADLREYPVSEVWIAWKDGQDHSSRRRKKSTKTVAVRENTTQDNEALFVFNENPNENLIGDCAVRAVAGVLEISWKEAVRKLAEAQDYAETIINKTSNIEALLRKERFQEFGAIRRNGRILTGKKFCDIIHDMFQAGTRIFAYVGNSHVVAILVFDEDYKIVDTWDSTSHRITKYWAKYPERPQRHTKPAEPEKLTRLTVGMQIRHRTFGVGEVISMTDTIATVRFQDAEKKLAAAWILANCMPV